jgi:hypothetical protein
MADKEFKFHLKTTGDPKGAEVVEQAIKEVSEASESLGTTTSGGTETFEKSLRETAVAATVTDKAVDELERSVELLNEELAKNKTLSADQAANLKKVADGGERLARIQRQQKTTTDAATKSTSNLGMGALAAAQAFEDMQYGIRGVLNNIPQMVLMFGGSAGLTAVISIAAVAGNLLFEKLTKGAASTSKSQDELNDSLAESVKFYRELAAAELRTIEARGRAFEDRLALAQKEAQFAEKAAGDRDSLEALRGRRNAEIAIAQEKLALLREEARIIQAGGETAAALTKAREASQQRILAIEKQVTEQVREQELSALRRKLADAEDRKATAGQGVDGAQRQVAALFKEVQVLSEELNASQTARLARIEGLQARIENIQEQIADIRAGNRPDLNANQQSTELVRLNSLLESLPAQIPKLLETPEQEVELSARISTQSELLTAARKNLDEATTKWGEIADAVKAAAQELKTAQERQGIDRGAEQQIQQIEKEIVATRGPDQSQAIDALGNLANQLEGSPALAGVMEQIKGFISDKSLTADELVKTQVLLGQFFAKIANLGATQNSAIRDAVAKVDDLERDVRTIRTNQSTAIPGN